MPACSINWCKKSSKTSNLQKDGITFHLFPRNYFQRRRWAEVCNRTKDWTPTSSSSICSRHFEYSQFQVVPNNRRVLIKNAMPSLLLNKYELDMANLRHVISRREIMKKKISDCVKYSENEDIETDSKPTEYLQKYIQDLLPDLPDNNAIFVIIVNNERNKNSAAETNGQESSSVTKQEEDKDRLRALNIERELRKKIARKSQLAEKRRKKIRALTQTRTRLLRRNAILTRIIVQMKTRSIVGQLQVDPAMGSALNGEIIDSEDFVEFDDDKSDDGEYLRLDEDDDGHS